ncbi:uncharacterized protein At5g08430-like isoform X2 [Momordica charantia]|uniref:Uncharacterized protein At5g08430-like isoform X2 n=1 Tax=Momordica charantia TaxID=3673 RepID=A0A6J1C6N4_MOMCH|nr:uncharacterized protein At5g08430-like isoform X2 [Momordica charantia]
MGKKKCKTKEEIGEDFCFHCKDGGQIRFCDFRDCLKAYHADCVGKEESFVESEDRWICAVCGRCISISEFVHVRGYRGFCSHCLKLALLIENGEDVDSDGTKIDFNDSETYEFLFKEYWELMKVKEGLTAKDVRTASNLLMTGSRSDFNSNEIEESEEDTDEYEISSDYEEQVDTEEGHKLVRKGKRSKEKLGTMKKMKSSNKEFIGWGSKPIIDFLSKIGKDTSQKLSQDDVTSIIIAYCKENKLFHPQKKKKIVCDAKLRAVFGRKAINMISVYNQLTAHFAENMEQPSDDESTSSIEEKDDTSSMACKRPRKLVLDRKPAEQEPSHVSHNCSAAIIAENVKLVYLKKSLVERLLENHECFEGKMMGSFIRAKSDPNDYSQKNSYQLLQVTGIKTYSSNTEKQKILLQVTNRLDYIPINNLSDDDFCEEECKDLLQRVRNGLLKKPTVAELYEKAKSLHEDITKHWITRELTRLQTCIDHANEKGKRRELFEYMEKRLLLQKSSEQARLINELPKVIADIPEPTFDDLLERDEQVSHKHEAQPPIWGLQHKALVDTRDDGKDVTGRSLFSTFDDLLERDEQVSHKHEGQLPIWGLQHKAVVDTRDDRKDVRAVEVEECQVGVPTISEKQQHFDVPTCKDFAKKSCISAAKSQTHQEQHQSILPKEHPCSETLVSCTSKQDEATVIQESKLKSEGPSEVQLIELSDDDGHLRVEDKKQNSENPNCPMWYCASPQGETRGPLPLSLLKQWRDSSAFELKCKVWKSGQSSAEAILLSDAIRLLFPE